MPKSKKNKRSPGEKVQLVRRYEESRDKAKLCADEGVPASTMRRWRAQLRAKGHLRRKRGSGRPRKLTKYQVAAIFNTLKKAPSTSNAQIVVKHKLPVCPRTISVYTKRRNYTKKRVIKEEPNMNVAAANQFLRRIKRIPWRRRVYQDESFLYSNEAPPVRSCASRRAYLPAAQETRQAADDVVRHAQHRPRPPSRVDYGECL
jgi:transposase-like protein